MLATSIIPHSQSPLTLSLGSIVAAESAWLKLEAKRAKRADRLSRKALDRVRRSAKAA